MEFETIFKSLGRYISYYGIKICVQFDRLFEEILF